MKQPLDWLYRIRERSKPILPRGVSHVELINLTAVSSAWPARAIVLPEPLAWPLSARDRALLDQDPKYRGRIPVLPPLFLSELPGATLFVQHGAIAAREGPLLLESANSLKKLVGSEVFGSLRRRPSEEWSGAPLTTILSPGRGRNWYHWLTDSLPRLFALSRLGERAALAVPDSLFPAQRESLELALPDNLDLVQFARKARVRAAKLILSPFTTESGSGLQRPEIVDYLRGRMLAKLDPAPSPYGRRILVNRPRTAGRHLENAEALSNALGLRDVDPGKLSFREQLRLFRDAELIVGPHGANLAGIIFAKNARVVEVWPNGLGDGTAVHPYYWGMASASGNEYRRVLHDERVAVTARDERTRVPIRAFRADVERVVAAASA